MTTHTPGPWLLDFDMLKDGHILVHTTDYGVAKVYDEEAGSRATNEANARLIAAAPDLLAAAQKALNFIENTEGEMGEALSCGDCLRAAIARAKGE